MSLFKSVVLLLFVACVAVFVGRKGPTPPRTYSVKVEDFKVNDFISTNEVRLERLDNGRIVGPVAQSSEVLTNGQPVSVKALMARHWPTDRFLCFMAEPK